VPEPLRKLGAIQPLRLFLGTTVDSLLANALGSPTDLILLLYRIGTATAKIGGKDNVTHAQEFLRAV
jgi:hypothetical protein